MGPLPLGAFCLFYELVVFVNLFPICDLETIAQFVIWWLLIQACEVQFDGF